MDWLILALDYAGLAALALAMDAHHCRVFPIARTTAWRARVRLAGWGLLAAAWGLAFAAAGPGVGFVTALVATAAAGFVLALLLAYRPRWLALPPLLAVIGACLSAALV